MKRFMIAALFALDLASPVYAMATSEIPGFSLPAGITGTI